MIVQELLAGETTNRKIAAKNLNLKSEYFRRILGCAFLAPDILEAILDGRYTDQTVKKLCWRQLPMDCAGAAGTTGIPPSPTTS